MLSSIVQEGIKLFLLFYVISASRITFTTPTAAITPLMTSDLEMTCTLEDTTSGGSNLIGRDVTQTADDLTFIMSMVITRHDGDHVALVTQTMSATALMDPQNINVTGAIADPASPGPRAHLHLLWADPSGSQGGEYVCEVNAMNGQGHNIVFSQTLNIPVQEPTINAIVQHMHDMRVNNSGLAQTVRTLQQKVQRQEQTIQNQQNDLHNIQTQTGANEMGISELNNKTSHIETGQVWCGDSDTWTDEGRHVDIHSNFTSPYPSSPIVYLGTRYFYSDDGNSSDYYSYTLHDVDTDGFNVRCWKAAGVAHAHITNMAVNWISFSK